MTNDDNMIVTLTSLIHLPELLGSRKVVVTGLRSEGSPVALGLEDQGGSFDRANAYSLLYEVTPALSSLDLSTDGYDFDAEMRIGDHRQRLGDSRSVSVGGHKTVGAIGPFYYAYGDGLAYLDLKQVWSKRQVRTTQADTLGVRFSLLIDMVSATVGLIDAD